LSLKKYNNFIDPQSTRVMIGDHFFDLEICKDHVKGLSKRDKVEMDGMIFMYNEPISLSYHMKDCRIPLDILFCRDGQVVDIHHNCPPCKSLPCKKYECDSSDLVIELPGKTCSSLGITSGLSCQIV